MVLSLPETRQISAQWKEPRRDSQIKSGNIAGFYYPENVPNVPEHHLLLGSGPIAMLHPVRVPFLTLRHIERDIDEDGDQRIGTPSLRLRQPIAHAIDECDMMSVMRPSFSW